jgi:hypothetical protein
MGSLPDKIGAGPLRLSYDPPGGGYELAIAVFQSSLVAVGERAGCAIDFKNAPLRGASVIDHVQCASLASLRDPFERAGQDANAVAEECGVRRMMDVGLDDGGIGAELATRRDAFALRSLNYSRMNVPGRFGIESSERATEGGKRRNRFLVEAGKPTVDQAGPDLALELTQGPLLDVLEHAAAQ